MLTHHTRATTKYNKVALPLRFVYGRSQLFLCLRLPFSAAIKSVYSASASPKKAKIERKKKHRKCSNRNGTTDKRFANNTGLLLCIMQIDAHNCYLKISGYRSWFRSRWGKRVVCCRQSKVISNVRWWLWELRGCWWSSYLLNCDNKVLRRWQYFSVLSDFNKLPAP